MHECHWPVRRLNWQLDSASVASWAVFCLTFKPCPKRMGSRLAGDGWADRAGSDTFGWDCCTD